MDMLTVDLTDHPQAGVGSRVELWGSQVPAVEVVAHSQTSTYRLLSAVKRVPLVHRGCAHRRGWWQAHAACAAAGSDPQASIRMMSPASRA